MYRTHRWLLLIIIGLVYTLSACQTQKPTAHTTPPTATASTSTTTIPTPGTTIQPTTTPTLIGPTPTPVSGTSGWKTLRGLHFTLAYPPSWTAQPVQAADTTSDSYNIIPPSGSNMPLSLYELADGSKTAQPGYCTVKQMQTVTLAGLPMAFVLAGEFNTSRTWSFENAEGTFYTLSVSDAQAAASIQQRDSDVLNTFLPDNTTPWPC